MTSYYIRINIWTRLAMDKRVKMWKIPMTIVLTITTLKLNRRRRTHKLNSCEASEIANVAINFWFMLNY